VTYFPIGKGPIRPVSEGFNGSFSPDGRLVVMEAWERRGLDLATSDGRKRFVLTAPGGQARDEHPSFTPSGNRVVFARGDYTTGDYDIYSIRLDGTGLTNLTAGFATRAIEPDVSPNGRAIVFMGRDPDGDHIYRMSSDGSNPTRLHTPDHLLPYQPSWGGSFRCAGKRATIVGDDGRDKIKGTKGNDVIVGNAGPDRIYGRGGKDRICGGDGPDKLLGGKGVDRLVGGPGPDRLRQQGR
jgi:Tol biopolymer transport system component